MNNHPLLQYISTTSKHLLWQFGNSGTFGIPEALRSSANEIYLQSKLANEGLYYLQVKTFLETLELDANDIEKFMKENPNHQRLGFEIFKILEHTILDKQAKMLAKAFQLFTQKQIFKQEFDKYTYIITRLNSHLIHLIDDLSAVKTNLDNPKYEFDIENPNMEFVSFGFLKEVSSPLYPGSTQIARFKRTDSFYCFYENIFKD
ncbi:hypothetical protein [Acinetobacter pragensis]|uniref:Uncharacterized protein n=1 Tax=Acinetobacter pragensis TaxID=1806892 RepID=A0A151Y1Q3_9GAMM|nr:hypothetical protein [Acinetobacter pragensis]KYQ71930.1 hypothetical protein AZH43_11925 [Acinetobacter pragensis]